MGCGTTEEEEEGKKKFLRIRYIRHYMDLGKRQ
jgi:hypothetical protein